MSLTLTAVRGLDNEIWLEITDGSEYIGEIKNRGINSELLVRSPNYLPVISLDVNKRGNYFLAFHELARDDRKK